MHRRALLRSAGLAAGALAAGGALGACGEEAQPPGRPPGKASVETSTGEEQSLVVISASFETLAGTDRRFAFGVTTADSVPLREADLDVRVHDLEGNELAGPFPAEFVDAGGPLGVYVTRIDVPEPGRVVVVVRDGDAVGEVAVSVVAPEDSKLPVPGEAAPVTATPTVADPMGLERLCTLEPEACGMHEVSLDEAIAGGRPVVLLFATPAYCQTAVCGPAVENLEAVRTDGDWGDVAFVHVEIYSDAGRSLTPPVVEWNLPSEPWVFTIAGDGTVVDRLDAILVPQELRAMTSALL
ncbi:MAG TPA: hypothetical protein VM324_07220 [Egibacteraceae bacterium]|nr:hypothetical protein [Egibacteraceae bacterium]